MSSSAPHPMSSNAPLHMRHPTRRSAPPPTSKSVPAQDMEGMAREVLTMEANRNAQGFPSKVVPVSQSKSQYRNAPVCPRKTANRWQCRLQQSPEPLYPSRTASRCPGPTAKMSPGRAAPVCPRTRRCPSKSAAPRAMAIEFLCLVTDYLL